MGFIVLVLASMERRPRIPNVARSGTLGLARMLCTAKPLTRTWDLFVLGVQLVGRRHKLKHEMCINVTFWVKGEAALGLKIG